MLKQIKPESAGVKISNAAFPAPFSQGLEYSAPARGTWNIVHTGMLVPQAHEIFVCAAGCLRGVVLTAAEMDSQDRFSTVEVRENNVLDGDMEDLIIDGVSQILNELPTLPPAVLLYTSCIHQFMGCDLTMIFNELRSRFPSVDFTDCYMNPTMRKSGLTPDQLMRRQLYSLLKERPASDNSVVLLGNDLPTKDTSDIVKLISDSGWSFSEITRTQTYDEYQELAAAKFYISTYPAAKAGAEVLAKRLNRHHIYLRVSYNYDEIDCLAAKLASELGTAPPDSYSQRNACEAILATARNIVGDTPIYIDYTAVSRPLGLARLLIDHGFNVTRVYLDAISGEEAEDFKYLQKYAPEIMLMPTVQAVMRVLPREDGNSILAIGQKAAYFSGTRHFVNIVEDDGNWGYDGIVQITGEIIRAAQEEKDTKSLIQIKGWGCGCCH